MEYIHKMTQFESDIIAESLAQAGWGPERIASTIARTSVKEREATGVGVYVYFKDRKGINSDDIKKMKIYGLDFGWIHVPGIPLGLQALLYMLSSELYCLELVTAGEDQWDGNTSIENYVIKNPDSE